MASIIEKQLLKIKREAEEREAKRKAEKSGAPYIDLFQTPVQVEALKLISENQARAAKLIPVETRRDQITLAVLDTDSTLVQEAVSKFKSQGHSVGLRQASLSGLEYAWQKYKEITPERAEVSGRVDVSKEHLGALSKKITNFQEAQKEIAGFNFQESPISDVLEIILAGAVTNRASDIHFESELEAVRIRYRIDGRLHDVYHNFPKSYFQTLLSRLKLLSGLKIDITSKAQDGRFTIELGQKEIELRVSTIPAEFGETVVVRVLDPDIINVPLEQLGLRDDDLEIVLNEIKEPNGMILNTGPTGSGKTTTLYGFLKKRQNPEIKIITIEDPIEYNLEDVEQTQVNPEAGYSFANGLSSIMRQDPDVILVGEIRDKETAGIAVQAALTGHLVFSTVHANRAAGAIPRLLDLEVKPTSVGPALNLIMAQRLVRRLCGNCKKKVEISAEINGKIKNFLEKLPVRVKKEKYANLEIFEAVGCEQCGVTGFKGRVGVFELLIVGKEAEIFIEKQASETEMHEFAVKQGMVTMQQDGILKVLLGVTSFTEVEAATGHLDF